MSEKLQGSSLIGFTRGQGAGGNLQAVNPASGETLSPAYSPVTGDEFERAMTLAKEAFPIYAGLPVQRRADFLRKIAENIDASVDDFAERGPLETGLPEGRMRGETGRTSGQLRLFASLIEEGSWVNARIEHALPEREPIPKPDVRSMLVPLGPVAVFCASNFPLAFSVAGGDTASALASGCPVVVKAHHSHLGMAELVGDCVARAAQETGMPDGVFSLLYGGRDIGTGLVEHAAIQAVGFTGSRGGGTALMKIAAERAQPIPVYAEMSSINPVILLPGALAEKGAALAEGFFGSLTLGAGQFCTNPGLVFLPQEGADEFLSKLAEQVSGGSGATMLNVGIYNAYSDRVKDLAASKGVELLAAAPVVDQQATPAVFTMSVEDFVAQPDLQDECFGPATLIVRGPLDKITAALGDLEGQLTGSIFGTDAELAEASALVSTLQNRVGRVMFNNFPTGVEVCHSMVHGGPYPSTSDGRSTSVGTLAIERFCRYAAWQSFPEDALPEELKDENPRGISRLVDGKHSH